MSLEDLTPREDEVLQLLAQGMTNKAIAHQLGITDHTVKFHVNAIMTKLNAQSRTDAVIRATRVPKFYLAKARVQPKFSPLACQSRAKIVP